jgi:oxygen-independent coproporphyrinogen-3 oxidase
VSSISETQTAFHQNEKVLPVWEQKVWAGGLPTHRGHKLSAADRRQREQILKFMTKGQVQLEPAEEEDARSFLAAMLEDRLVVLEQHHLRITEAGRPFLRNACAFFDLRLRQAQPSTRIFSQSI